MTARRFFPAFALIVLSFVATSAAAQTYVWNQTGTAAYTTSTNWTPTRTTPAATDVLVFNNGATTVVTGVPTQTIAQLQVSANTNVTLQAAATSTLSIAGGAGTDLSVAAGSQLNVNTATALTISLAAGATGVIDGSMTFSAGAHRLLAASASGITFQNGSTFTAGTSFSGNAFGTTSLNSVVFASGSKFVFIAGANPFGATQPSSVVVFQTGSTYVQQGSGTPAFSGRTYANFELNVAATVSPTGGSAVSIDNLTITQGTLNFGMTGAPGHSIKGNISIAAAGTLAFNPATAGTVNLNGAATQTITNAGTLTLNDADQTVNVNNANGIVLASNVTFQLGVLQFTSGNVSTGANTLTIGSGASVSRTSGHVIGQLKKDFAANGSKVFEVGTANGYSPFTANVTAGTPGNITCAAVQGPQPNMNPATSLQRYWTLGASAGITADLTFQYLDPPDVAGNEALYKVYRVSGGVPSSFPGSSVNAATNTGTVSGISTFSDWTLGEVAAGIPNLTVTNVTQSETNGATTFTFQVNLDAPAGPSGVTFDIATADGTAQDDTPATEDNDYVAQTITGATIVSGNSSYAFNVTVNGDVSPEADETFFVNVTNVVGATPADTQGLGTIQNDDVACANLSIDNVTQSEGTGGTTNFTFTVSLSQAGCGAVTFDIATADGTAQDDVPNTEDNDYVPQSLTGQTLTFPGTYSFTVAVNGDSSAEPNETFFVNVTNVSPANVNVLDGQGLGTINNDDFTKVHDVQGNGTASPLVGQSVTLRGIVTLLKSNGFFLQEELADYDGDVNTSEGVFVFTSSAPTVTVGTDATVTGTVTEFNGLTEISTSNANVTTNSTGNTLPAPVTLTPADLPTNASYTQAQLEKYEGMRLLALSLTTVAPNDTFYDVYTVLTGQPRPMREAGIPVADPIPPDPTSNTVDPNIPVWDMNPERLSVDTNGRAGSTGETLTSNVVLTNVAGPLDYAFSEYHLINEAALTRSSDVSAVTVPIPTASQFTVAGYNIENFNNATTQRQKAALTIRDVLLLPDVIGTVEIFDLADLQALATEIQNISGVTYAPYLIEQDGTSEDADQDVGFLVKTSRVSVTSVTAERTTDTYINPNTNSPETLHDRPPLVLRGTVDPSGPSPTPIIVVVNHMRSFIDIELVSGEGVRVRAKRKAQAESLAGLYQELQTNYPAAAMVWVGDYNAFHINNGYDDPISVIKGVPTPDDQIVVDQSPDVVNPNAYNLVEDVPAAQRYSFVFEGTPQVLDQMLVNPVAHALNTNIAMAHVNSDFPEAQASAYASNAARPERNSDHDPVVGYFQLASADVSLTKTLNTSGPYTEGDSISYTITVSNAGPVTATNVQVTDTPTNLTITNVSGSGCTAMPCTIASIASGGSTNITVTATIAAAGAFDNSATATATESDPNSANNTDNTGNGGTAAAYSADISVTKTLVTGGPYVIGQSVTYTVLVSNGGPNAATNIQVTDTPSNLTITGVTSTNCSSFPCTIPSLAASASESITVTATIDAVGAFDNSASATATQTDPNGANNTDNTGNGGTAVASADVMMNKTLNNSSPYYVGASVTYILDVSNQGPSTATNIQVTDTPANLTITNVSGGGCTALPCTISSLASGANVQIFVDATINSAGAFDNSATADADEFDPNSENNTDNTGNGDTATSSADVAMSKVLVTGGPYNVGQTVTYTLDVTNYGPSTATSVQVTDTPTNLTITNVSGGGCAALPCTIASIASGATVQITVTATINTVGAFDNSATATATESDPNLTNNTDNTGNGSSTNSAADISVVKSFVTAQPYRQADVITMNLLISNTGPNTATNITVKDAPVGLTVQNMTGGGCINFVFNPNPFPGNGTCTIPSLASGASVNVTVTASIMSAGQFLNTATVTGAEFDPDTANNTSSVNAVATSSTDLSITKTLNTAGPYYPGQSISYTLVALNSGPSPAVNVQLTDTPTNLTINTVSGGCTSLPCTIIPALLVGQPRTINVTATINAAGPFDNSATVTGQDFDPNTANNTDNTGNGGVAAASADVSLVKTLTTSGPYSAGQSIAYTLVVANAGPSTATSVQVTDTPTNLTITSVSGGGCAALPCTIASIASGASVTVNLTATITSVGSFNNSATATAVEADSNVANNTDNTGNGGATLASVDVSLVKTLTTSGPYSAGQSIAYTLVVANAGPSTATTVQVTDTPTNLTITSVSGGGCAALPCTIASIASGASVTINVTATITAAGSFNNSATATAAETDSNLANNTDNTGNGGSTGTGGDSDGDGVSDVIEQGAPNGGDGNGDGIADYLQSSVASLPAANGNGYLTLQSSCSLQQVSVTTEEAQPTPDPGFVYHNGLISFRAPCSSATFSLFIYGSGAASAYRKFGPVPPGGPQEWYSIPATFTVATVGSLHPRRADFSLVDGAAGDDTPVDGVIVDQGGPGDPLTPIPTLSEWMLLLLAAMLGLVAVFKIQR